MKAAITKTLLKELPTGRDVDIYDTTLKGFVLRVRKSGTAVYRVNYDRGKWYTLGHVSKLDPAEARALAKGILGDHARGVDVAASRRRAKASTLRDYLDKVYEPWVIANRKDGKATIARLRNCFEAELGARRLHEITPWVIEKWRTKRRKSGTAVSTINRDIAALNAAMNRAVQWHYTDKHPFAGVKPLKMDDNKAPRFLSPAEERRLRLVLAEREEKARAGRDKGNAWREARGYPTLPDLRATPYVDRLRPIVLLALNTGMRRGEIFGLSWADIDRKQAVVTVRGAGAKSGKTRHIPLNAEALAVLKGWQKTTGAESGLVFPGQDGARVDNIQTSWERLLKAAKISNFRFHDLRHTFASKLVMAGVDLNTVRELLGHSDLKMTLRYAHLAPEHKAQAVAKLVAPVDDMEAGGLAGEEGAA